MRARRRCSARRAREEQRRHEIDAQQSAEEAFRNDPHVRELEAVFAGEVVSGSVKPAAESPTDSAATPRARRRKFWAAYRTPRAHRRGQSTPFPSTPNGGNR